MKITNINTMKRAHKIAIKASKKFNVKKSEIVFAECLKMSWKEKKQAEYDAKTKVKSVEFDYDKDVKIWNVKVMVVRGTLPEHKERIKKFSEYINAPATFIENDENKSIWNFQCDKVIKTDLTKNWKSIKNEINAN